MRLEVPDFVEGDGSVGPDIPVYRSWLEAIAGRQVNLVSVRTEDVQRFASLQPSSSLPEEPSSVVPPSLFPSSPSEPPSAATSAVGITDTGP